MQSAESGSFISISHDQPCTVSSKAETLPAVAAVTTHSRLSYTRAQTSASRRRPNRPVMSLTMPPLGDGDDDGDGEGDGDDPVTDDTADATGEVTEDPGDDSAGAGPTPPVAVCEECVHGPDSGEPTCNAALDTVQTDSRRPKKRPTKQQNMFSIQSNPTTRLQHHKSHQPCSRLIQVHKLKTKTANASSKEKLAVGPSFSMLPQSA